MTKPTAVQLHALGALCSALETQNPKQIADWANINDLDTLARQASTVVHLLEENEHLRDTLTALFDASAKDTRTDPYRGMERLALARVRAARMLGLPEPDPSGMASNIDEDDERRVHVEDVLARREDGTFAFVAGGVQVDYPFDSTCGRFTVTPDTYGFEWISTGGSLWAWARDFTADKGMKVYMLISTMDQVRKQPSEDEGFLCTVGVYRRGDADRFITWSQPYASDTTSGDRMPATCLLDHSEGMFSKSEAEVLSEELEAWCAAQGRPFVDGMELQMSEDLSPNQRTWVDAFVRRWNAMQSEAAERERHAL